MIKRSYDGLKDKQREIRPNEAYVTVLW